MVEQLSVENKEYHNAEFLMLNLRVRIVTTGL